MKQPKAQIKNVVVVGMGSSLIAFKIISSVFEDDFLLPVSLVNKNRLPSWINKETLVVVSSYSGNSSETVSCAKQAIRANCVVVGISTNGDIEKLASKVKFFYKIKPELNYCAQPRLAIGYSYASFLKVFTEFKLIKNHQLVKNNFLKAVEGASKINKLSSFHKEAKSVSRQIKGKMIDVIGSSFLSANAELMAKQLSWNSKVRAGDALIPEAMHFMNEGIGDKKINSQRVVLFLLSNVMDKKTLQLNQILDSYLRKNKIETVKINLPSKTSLEASLIHAYFSSYLSFYLAMSYGINPSPTPGINFYKSRFYG